MSQRPPCQRAGAAKVGFLASNSDLVDLAGASLTREHEESWNLRRSMIKLPTKRVFGRCLAEDRSRSFHNLIPVFDQDPFDAVFAQDLGCFLK